MIWAMALTVAVVLGISASFLVPSSVLTRWAKSSSVGMASVVMISLALRVSRAVLVAWVGFWVDLSGKGVGGLRLGPCIGTWAI